MPYFRESLDLKREIDDTVGICNTLNNMCAILADAEELDHAESSCSEAFSSCSELDTPGSMIKPHDNYGYFLEKTGRLREALEYYQEAADLVAKTPTSAIDPGLQKQVAKDLERIKKRLGE